MRIYLIRHGQTTGDVEERYGGDYDDRLTDEGRAQARQLAEKLNGSGIEVIFCSPKLRAQETARIAAEIIGSKIEIIDNIRERNMYGILTGMVKREAKEKHPEHVAALKNHRHSKFRTAVSWSWRKKATRFPPSGWTALNSIQNRTGVCFWPSSRQFGREH